MAGGSKKVIVISLLANMGIAISKLVGAFVTGSASLMAEAVHSFSDCGNQGLLLYGQHLSAKPATAQYPMGRAKEGFFWSFIVALLLFSVGGMFSIYEGLHKFHESEPVTNPIIGFCILLVAVGLEGFSFYACLKEVRHVNRQPSLWAWVKGTTNADLLVIFMEDLAALLGLLIALTALTLTWVTGNPMFDAMGSVAVGVLLIVTAIILAREVKSLLIGEAPQGNYEPRITALLTEIMPGAKLLRVIAVQHGIDRVMLAYKIHPGAGGDVEGVINKINALEAKVKAEFPEIEWQFAELDYEK